MSPSLISERRKQQDGTKGWKEGGSEGENPAITNCVSLQLEYYVPENAEGGQITGVCVRV